MFSDKSIASLQQLLLVVAGVCVVSDFLVLCRKYVHIF